ncbi:aminotransferase class I/II-fold pyridoxal phosphate-dependent enzyme [archaeon]|jgi:aspartate/methionine/tyrosine aminotransferase|nr:aminotransferase class I/II-fold pyridoxal phosphate-dependent enzyme [archaeon]MBT3450562.1 aminotransferase class I/II-fold pyridoxal phosphate-dependent enzyme [archaeon]MBT6868416.1 aminotransferase class I/II-fold pyridoxal phosphate-dependent enzyme [archaeon]MBT7193515.1 aminotransferase class I/II-fold pyridoxal phosphate-dependent enzyme [archaeon]MBT7381290.1 aminotransferase class I/II-fold pyridoxal phosphate-dependent enzyme [archaeon]
MAEISKQAEEINKNLLQKTPVIYSLLSNKGKQAFFPSQGIIKQSQEAKGTRLNATVGQAFENNSEVMILPSFAKCSNLSNKETFLYSSSYGNTELRNKWKELILEKNYSVIKNESQNKISLPIVTNALTHGLYVVGQLFIEENDEIIVPDLIWGNYNLIFSQAKFNKFKLFNDENRFNIEGLRENMNSEGSKKILILNFPNNPTGYTPTINEAEQIKEVILEASINNKRILVICDDAYFGLNYEPNCFQESIFAKLVNLHDNVLTIKIDGVSKEYFSWGLRVGFITAGNKKLDFETNHILEDKFAGTIRATASNICTHSQNLCLKGLSSETLQQEKDNTYNKLKGRYEEVKQILNNKPEYKNYFEALPFNSGYFMCIKLKQGNAQELRKILIEKESIGLIAVNDNILRIAYSAIGKEDLNVIFEKIHAYLNEF